ncbi:MAG: M48 family metalloprotease [Clostridiaceae bacterium]|nr:M48 family metalloprotease [Clostridiaceae bacterium]
MKKFLCRTFLTFSFMFILLFLVTMAFEYTNKENLNSEVNVKYTVEESGKIQVPDMPPKVKVNYWYSNVYYFTSLAMTIVLPILFVKFGGIEIIKKCRFKRKVIEGIVFFLLYDLFSLVITFPKILFSSFYRAKLVGLSNESFSGFMWRFTKSNLMNLGISLLIFTVVYLFFIKKKRWYIYIIALSLIISFGGSYLYPYFDEIENDLVEMEDGELKTEIVNLANEAGIDGLDVRVVEKSSSTNSINAYMTGIGNTRRIVFWDTTLKLSHKDILSIAAHEMGHYKLKHIQKGTVLSMIMAIILVLVIHFTLKKLKGNNYRVMENVPLIILMINIISILSSPIETAYIRRQEYEADEYAMEMTMDPYTNGKLEVQFINTNLTPVDVNSVYKWLCYDHPTVKERIEHSNKFIEEHEECKMEKTK